MEKLKHLYFLLKKVTWRSPASRSVKTCPRCGSIKVKFSSKLDTWLTPRRYICNDCGYVGPIVLEIEETEKESETQED